MYMSRSEICRDYRMAKSRRAQVTILADMNLCKKEEIIKILISEGEDLTGCGMSRKKILKIMYDELDEKDEKISALEKEYINTMQSIKKFYEGKKNAGKCA